MAFGPNVPPIQAHLCVKGGRDAIAFYKEAFGAEETFFAPAEDGRRALHANLAMFGGEIMLHDDFPEMRGRDVAPASGPPALTISVNLASPADVDAAIARAAKAGAEVTLPADDMFWGARYGRIRDPFGHVWAFNAPLKT